MVIVEAWASTKMKEEDNSKNECDAATTLSGWLDYCYKEAEEKEECEHYEECSDDDKTVLMLESGTSLA